MPRYTADPAAWIMAEIDEPTEAEALEVARRIRDSNLDEPPLAGHVFDMDAPDDENGVPYAARAWYDLKAEPEIVDESGAGDDR